MSPPTPGTTSPRSPGVPNGHSGGVMMRKVKACTGCRALKIKCRMPTEEPPCDRCKARGLRCLVERNVQAILNENNKWHASLSGKVSQLQTAVNVLLRMSDLPPLASYGISKASSADEQPAGNNSTAAQVEGIDADASAHRAGTPVASPDDEDDDAIYSLPINSLHQVTSSGRPGIDNHGPKASLHAAETARSSGLGRPSASEAVASATTNPPDFISRGLVSIATAESLFGNFSSRLNYFCYGIACPYETLAQTRSASALLTAVICAVAALHDPRTSDAHAVCRREFQRLVAGRMFDHHRRPHSRDDVRAMVIGAYWLSNDSYVLVGHAVRIATGLNYHAAFFSVMDRAEGSWGEEQYIAADAKNGGDHSRSRDVDDEDFDKARLWYALYIQDQHSSILYGRPAIISAAEEPHQQWERFLRCASRAGEPDLRMASQVALYAVTTKVRAVFGSYAGTSRRSTIPEHFLYQQLDGHFVELDRWYMVWGDRMPKNAHVGWFPRDGAILHYHFARLHMCSYVFRGMTTTSTATSFPTTSPQSSTSISYSATAVPNTAVSAGDTDNASSAAKIREYASLAVSSATAVLEIVLARDHMRAALVGMPVYFHAMINFAAVFLLKVAAAASTPSSWPPASSPSGFTRNGSLTDLFASIVDRPRVWSLVGKVVAELKTREAARQHLVYHLGNGLDNMLQRTAAAAIHGQHDQRPAAEGGLSSTEQGAAQSNGLLGQTSATGTAPWTHTGNQECGHAEAGAPGIATGEPGQMPGPEAMDSLFMLDTFDLFQYPNDYTVDTFMDDGYHWSHS